MVYVPNSEGETDDELRQRHEAMQLQIDHVNMRRRLPRLRERCERAGVEFVEAEGPDNAEPFDDMQRRVLQMEALIGEAPTRTRRGCHAQDIFHDVDAPRVDRHTCSMTIGGKSCPHCFARLYPSERPNACCSGGKVHVPDVRAPSPFLHDLWTAAASVPKLFRKHARALNNALALASTKVDIPPPPSGRGGWQPTFCIQGRLYHRVGPVLPDQSGDTTPRFAQLYVYDPQNEDDEAQLRLRNARLDRDTTERERSALKSVITELQRELRTSNPYVRDFITASEIPEAEYETRTLRINPDRRPEGEHERRYNAPTGQGMSEISVLMSDAPSKAREIVVRRRGGGLRSVHETHRSFDPLHFVLLFPKGDDGWRLGMPHRTLEGGGAPVDVEDEDAADDNAADAERAAAQAEKKTRDVTSRQYYAFRLYYRPRRQVLPDGTEVRHDDSLFRACRLFQEYCCMAFAKTEYQRLNYLRTHQDDLRADLYQNLRDAFVDSDNGQPNAERIGKRVVLPATFGGSPRDMQRRYLDAMAMLARFGPRPDLFVTFTCNPGWSEITEHLLPGQVASDRPDVVARVFTIKLKALMDEITKEGIFGKCQAFCYSIEFQKRGLPHCHILLILDPRDKIKEASDVERIVCAELPPDRGSGHADEQGAILRARVTRDMLHSRCVRDDGSPVLDAAGKPARQCLQDKHPDADTPVFECSKHFPKSFSTETAWRQGDKYPTYRRREPASYAGARFTSRAGDDYDNRWVVPYSPYLLLRYDAHINVEAVISPFRIKYLYKYIHKGGDRATVEQTRERRQGTAAAARSDSNEPVDEIADYQDLRMIGSIEACWRIFAFDMANRDPAVYALPVHLENRQHVTFHGGNVQQLAQEPPDTALTAFFKFNAANPECRVPYARFPETHCFSKDTKKWRTRKRGFAIGRVHWAHPTDQERFNLRKLLHHDISAGATRYADLRTVDGHEHATFTLAARALGLCQDDEEWRETMAASVVTAMPAQIRDLFCTLILECEVSDKLALFREFAADMAEDYLRDEGVEESKGDGDGEDRDFVDAHPTAATRLLLNIEERLLRHGKSLSDMELPVPDQAARDEMAQRDRDASRRRIPHLIREQIPRQEDRDTLRADADQRRRGMLSSQAAVYDRVHALVEGGRGGCVFVDAPGGTGKTYSFNALLDSVRANDGIALAVASSGIASILLHLGRTVHSRFKVPVENLHDGSMCNITAQSDLGNLIRQTKLIVWDEAPMADRKVLEALDRTLSDIRGAPRSEDGDLLPFGGIVVVLGGDWRQILPVVKKGGRAQIVAATMKKSHLWRHFEQMSLTENMRVRRHGSDTRLARFAEWLLRLGDGVEPRIPGYVNAIEVPPDLAEPCDLNRAIDFAFPNLQHNYNDDGWIAERAILAPYNSTVTDINNECLNRLPGTSHSLLSADEAPEGADSSAILPPELLNSLEGDSLPPHVLQLKIGAALILTRNVNPAAGLCNGTRLILREVLRNRVLKCTIASGDEFLGHTVLLPRITIYGSAQTWGFVWKRRQFPVRLA
ncbi:MAG: hypothetical protein ACO38Z_10310, partial [Candidatus Nanopelagicales bacterium]